MKSFILFLVIFTLLVQVYGNLSQSKSTLKEVREEESVRDLYDRLKWWQKVMDLNDNLSIVPKGQLWDNKKADSSCEAFPDLEDEIREYKPIVEKIFETSLNGDFKGKTYKDLASFVDKFGPRFTGSEVLEKSIDYMQEQMIEKGFENVQTDNVTVPTWARGEEYAEMISPWSKKLHLKGLGFSVPTPEEGIYAEVTVINSFRDFKEIDKSKVKGKIVVYNGGGTGESGHHALVGASAAAKYGARAVLCRSVASFSLDTPHTGIQFYDEQYEKIPIGAITVEDAEMIDRIYQSGETILIFLKMSSTEGAGVSRNLFGDLKGREIPDEYVLVSGHIDSWDVGGGVVDDGIGSVLSLEVVELLQKLNLSPRRTIRSAMWTGEEIGLVGVQSWMKKYKSTMPEYQAVLEADYGCLQPWGLIFYGSDKFGCILKEIIKSHWAETNSTGLVKNQHVATDIYAFMRKGVPGIILHGDGNNRYFWYHHTDADTMTAVQPKQLDMCLALWTSLSYILADLKEKIPHHHDKFEL